MNIKISDWIAITEDGVWCSPFDEGKCLFSTKSSIIEDISDATMDARRKPKIKRLSQGEYEYTPKSCDTGHDGKSYHIIRLTSSNIDKYKQMLEQQTE